MTMDSLNEHLIPEGELMPLIRERLAAGQTVRYLPFRGVSMLPMLRQGKDAVEVGPVAGKLKKYDIPVYQYPSGKYVMHRIVGVKQDYYVCLGDNTYEYERIRPEQILAVVVAFRRGQKRISVDSFGYQLYSRIWVAIYPFRKLLKRIAWRLRRLLRWGKEE